MFSLVTLISWKSKKQDIVSRSSVEVEFCAIAQTASEVVWFRCLQADMGAYITTPTPLYAGNKNAIKIARNHVFHERTKHTLKWIVTLFSIIFWMALWLYLRSQQSYKLLISLQNPILLLVFAIYLANSCSSLIRHEFEGVC